VMDKSELDRLSKLSKLNTVQLARVYKEFVKGGTQTQLKTKAEVISAARKVGLIELMSTLDESVFGRKLSGDLDAFLQEKFYQESTVEDILFERIVGMFDTNGDRKISLEEMISGMSILISGSRADKAELLFNQIDKNHDGVLDYNELLELQRITLRAFRAAFLVGFRAKEYEIVYKYHLPRERLDELAVMLADIYSSDKLVQFSAGLFWKQADKNQDGKISKDEYISWFADEELSKVFREQVIQATAVVVTKLHEKTPEAITNWLIENNLMKH